MVKCKREIRFFKSKLRNYEYKTKVRMEATNLSRSASQQGIQKSVLITPLGRELLANVTRLQPYAEIMNVF
jgi:hypothetical protein